MIRFGIYYRTGSRAQLFSTGGVCPVTETFKH